MRVGSLRLSIATLAQWKRFRSWLRISKRARLQTGNYFQEKKGKVTFDYVHKEEASKVGDTLLMYHLAVCIILSKAFLWFLLDDLLSKINRGECAKWKSLPVPKETLLLCLRTLFVKLLRLSNRKVNWRWYVLLAFPCL